MIFRRLNQLHGAARRAALRRDVRRAALVICGAAGALGLVLFFTNGETEQAVAHAKRAFGQNTRVGSIVFMPLVGDACRQSVFDNDSGAIRPTDDTSCMQGMGRAQPNSEDGAPTSKVMAIGENFRK